MRAFVITLVIATFFAVGDIIQSWRLAIAKEELRQLTAALDATRAAQRADRETFALQIKLVREASKHAQDAHRNLETKAGLSDADWLNDVLASMWNKDTNGGAVSAGVDAGAVPGAGSAAGAATGKDPAAVQRGHDTPRD